MTLNAEGPVQILGQDTQGRVLVGPERREALLEEYDRRGMSAVKFAQYVGIKYSTLAYWLQSLDRPAEASGRRKLLPARATKKSALNVLHAVARSWHS